MIQRNLVDRFVLSFTARKKELNKEDFKEFGRILDRPYTDYMMLYKIYRDFQTSKEVTTLREEIFAN